MRRRSVLVWLAAAFSVLSMPGATVPSQAQRAQTTRLGPALSYPDSKTVTLRYARVVLEVSINGRHSERDNDRTHTETVSYQARVIYTEDPRASVTATLVGGGYIGTEVNPAAPDKSVMALTFAYSDTTSTPSGAGQAGRYLSAPVSNRYGATHFDLDATIATPWHDVPGHLVITTTGPDGEQTSENDLPCEVLARVPYHSSVGATPFTALANSLEAAGKDGDDPVLGGIVEVPWSKGGSFGSFSVPVLASSALAYNVVDTKAAWDAKGWDEPLYPGWLRVTWVLGRMRPSAV
jgi:hypothetical protein